MKLNKCTFAFTLAEVLITIGVIGIVAAMTIPTLMTNYQKHQVETRLKGFYSNINQALRLSQEENGDIDGLIKRKAYTYEENLEFMQKYIAPFIKLSGYKPCAEGINNVCATLLDGGGMSLNIDAMGGDIGFYLDGNFNSPKKIQHNIFVFQFAKNSDLSGTKINSPNFVEPYIFRWDGTQEGLKDPTSRYACAHGSAYSYCAKLIQMNGWKIPDDYPW